VNRGETVVWKAGNSELRCKLGIIGDVVLVLKAIVAYREFIHAAGVDRPCVGYAHLGTAHDLSLDGVDRLSGEWQECSIAVPIVSVSIIPSKGSPNLLLAGKDVIDLGGVCVPREDGAAAVESEGVIDVFWQRRVRNQGEKNGSGITELTGRDDIQVAARRKRITDDRVGVRSQTSHWIDLPGGYSTSGCRIVDFVLKYGPTQRVGANLRLNPGLSVA